MHGGQWRVVRNLECLGAKVARFNFPTTVLVVGDIFRQLWFTFVNGGGVCCRQE